MTDYKLLSPSAQMHKDAPILFVTKWVQMVEGDLGVLPQKILNLVDVISCILVPFLGWQERGNT